MEIVRVAMGDHVQSMKIERLDHLVLTVAGPATSCT
jgi:hypothetical protein